MFLFASSSLLLTEEGTLKGPKNPIRRVSQLFIKVESNQIDYCDQLHLKLNTRSIQFSIIQEAVNNKTSLLKKAKAFLN